jgi:hypothetical protein
MTMVLRVAGLVAFALAVAGATVGGAVGEALGLGAVAVVVGMPLLRVAVLGVGWVRQGDSRFALVAGGLLLVIAAGAVAG